MGTSFVRRNSAEERAHLDVVSLCAKPIVVIVIITHGFWLVLLQVAEKSEKKLFNMVAVLKGGAMR